MKKLVIEDPFSHKICHGDIFGGLFDYQKQDTPLPEPNLIAEKFDPLTQLIFNRLKEEMGEIRHSNFLDNPNLHFQKLFITMAKVVSALYQGTIDGESNATASEDSGGTK